MQISILVATYNNIDYLKLFLNSVEKNSFSKHEILLHINDGSDGTLEYVKKKNLNLRIQRKILVYVNQLILFQKK